jgi:hypothetical protein
MKKIFIFLFALFSLTNSFNIHEIALNTEYIVDIKKYKEGYIPSDSTNYFKFPLEDDVNNIEFVFKVLRGEFHIFRVNVCGYAEEPSQDEIINRRENCSFSLPADFSQKGIFDIYNYTFDIGENVKYISFLIYNEYDCEYLSVCANGYAKKEKQLIFTKYDINYMKELELNSDILEKHEGIFHNGKPIGTHVKYSIDGKVENIEY